MASSEKTFWQKSSESFAIAFPFVAVFFEISQ
jgi:hypothetical protein